jgi:hypothetical protein
VGNQRSDLIRGGGDDDGKVWKMRRKKKRMQSLFALWIYVASCSLGPHNFELFNLHRFELGSSFVRAKVHLEVSKAQN